MPAIQFPVSWHIYWGGDRMKVECLTVGAFSVNTYLLTDEKSRLSAIVDTGESEELVWRLKGRKDLHIAMILLFLE